MTIAMLALAGFPATAGFIGKFYLIDASVAGDYAWLGVMIVIGSVISLAYYLRVVAVMWMGGVEVELPTVPARRVAGRGWSPEADARAQPEVLPWRCRSPRRRSSSGSAGPALRPRARRGHLAYAPALTRSPAPRSSGSRSNRPVRVGGSALLCSTGPNLLPTPRRMYASRLWL